jgi:hypothetical protein
MSTRNLALLSLLLVPAMSCSDRTAPDDAATRPSFDNRPAEPGNSGIFRFQGEIIEAIFDFNTGLVAVIGLQNSIADLCNDLGVLDLADFQLKPHQLGEVNSLINTKSATIQILAIPPESQGDFCLDFAGQPVLYQGTGTFQRTDNNLTPTGSEGGRANSFGFLAQGVLTDQVDGSLSHFTGILRLLISPKGEFKEIVSSVTVN